MTNKRVKVTQESNCGRNQKFRDTYKCVDITRPQFVKEIEKGNYPNYHVRGINGIKTPVSNPDATKDNNLD